MARLATATRRIGFPTPYPGNYTVLSTTPANAATDVPIDQTIKIDFSTAMLGTTINNTNITMNPSPARNTTLYKDDCTVFIDPTSNLSNNIEYTVTVTTNVKSLFGQQPLSAQYQFSFTTVA